MKRAIFQSTVLVTACVLVGLSFGFALFAYTRYTSLLETRRSLPPRTFALMIAVTAFDTETSLLYGTVQSGVLPKNLPVAITVRSSTYIEGRTPEVHDGVITKLSPSLPSTSADLRPGTIATVMVELGSDDRFIANSILIGDVFNTYGNEATSL